MDLGHAPACLPGDCICGRNEPEPTAQELIERFGPCDHPNAGRGGDGGLYCGHCSAPLPPNYYFNTATTNGHKA